MYLEISNPMDYHVALYIRLSKEDETEGPSQSVTNQKSLLNEFVQQHRLSVYDTYIDDGWSGTSFDRPDFQRMIGDIEAKKVNMVITKDLSRLGRDYIMTGHYMERYFPEKRVRYISLLDGIDTGVESTANDITPFRAIMNDMYAKDISKKIKSVKRDKQRKGQFIGGKPMYGYLDVSVHRVPLLTLCIGVRILEVCSSGFPHSEISGSKDICSSPKLFAAYHVFHRLLVPRHPPYALISITNSTSSHGNGIMSTHT